MKQDFTMLIQKGWSVYKKMGASYVIIKIFKYMIQKIYWHINSYLFQFLLPEFDIHLSKDLNLQIREIHVTELELIHEKIKIAPKAIYNRLKQKARLFGAIYEGKIIECCWCFSGGTYRDIVDGFTITLGPREYYLFDYQGISNQKPFELGSFRLIKALMKLAGQSEEKKTHSKLIFYSNVDQNNSVSVVFHERYLKARKIARIQLYRVLIWRYYRYSKITSLSPNYI